MKKRSYFLVLIVVLTLLSIKSYSQVSAVKINVPAFALGVINAEIETAISPNMSINLSLLSYPWGGTYIKGFDKVVNFTIQPGVRYWFHGLHTGAFLGAHATALYTDLSRNNRDYRIASLGVGASGGYAWMLAPRWNLELEIGLSALYLRYDSRPTGGSYTGRLAQSKWIPFPSKAGVNIVYLF